MRLGVLRSQRQRGVSRPPGFGAGTPPAPSSRRRRRERSTRRPTRTDSIVLYAQRRRGKSLKLARDAVPNSRVQSRETVLRFTRRRDEMVAFHTEEGTSRQRGAQTHCEQTAAIAATVIDRPRCVKKGSELAHHLCVRVHSVASAPEPGANPVHAQRLGKKKNSSQRDGDECVCTTVFI